MKVIMYYPEHEDDIQEFKNRVADFHATLLVERIKQLNVSDSKKKELLNSIITKLENEMCE